LALAYAELLSGQINRRALLDVGVALSARTRKRIVEVNERVQRIVAGNLRERLPHWKAHDPFSTLTMIVNGMIDEMETLIHSQASAMT
jgi:methyl-accepting chemotaxis protein